MRATEFVSLFGVQGGVNAAEDNPASSLTDQAAQLKTAMGIRGVNTDSDDIPGLNPVQIKGFQCLVGENRVAILSRRRGCQYKQPAGSYDTDSKRYIAGID